ncbi:DUF6624 domain-containing protein [Mucilaginibacter celer]|uniref:Tetratricopeptide repeat protein n=1 Tax=Mucilaginibacter celer TaxID=2305508 RepID=A0A494VUX3_9SPHI|nr:DUF6624 domain-containing protein [Mucilaginibacter celer]AYL98199.1 hypothetical protein HYN43_024230 [Mucilaginibacter celer]
MRLKYLVLLLMICSFHTSVSGQDRAATFRAADSLFAVKKYKKAAKFYTALRAGANGIMDTAHLYNAAACWAALNRRDSAYRYLELLSKRRFKNYDKLAAEPLFRKYQHEVRWEVLKDAVIHNRTQLIEPVAIEFSQMLKEYQANYDKYIRLLNRYGKNSATVKEFKEYLHETDSINFIKVSSIVNTYGWRGKTYFGRDAAEAMIIVLMHADIAGQKKYFSIVRNAALEGALPAEGFAIIAENIDLNENNTQIYGTHVKITDDGQYQSFAIADEAGVDKRREEIGLCSLAIYLHNFKPDGRSYFLVK